MGNIFTSWVTISFPKRKLLHRVNGSRVSLQQSIFLTLKREALMGLFGNWLLRTIFKYKWEEVKTGLLSQYSDCSAGESHFDSRRGNYFSAPHSIHTGCGTHEASHSRRPRREAAMSPLPNVEVRNRWSHTSIPSLVFLAWCLTGHKGNFALKRDEVRQWFRNIRNEGPHNFTYSQILNI
jgi:hypothetical protein